MDEMKAFMVLVGFVGVAIGVIIGGIACSIGNLELQKKYDRVLRDRSFWEKERAYIKKESEPDGFLPYTDWSP